MPEKSIYSHLIRPVTVKNLCINGNIFLAPMAGYTDAGFRSLCIEYGAFFTYTEMVSAVACVMKSRKTLNLLKRAQNESIIGVQLFGGDPSVIAGAVREIRSYQPSLIDINCGCSIPKILKSGSGAALLKNPQRIAEIIRAALDNTDVPVTLKIRSGWDTAGINFLEVGHLAEQAGASLITLHPRTRSALFSGTPDLDHIKALKQSLSIPVIGSGDLFSPEDVVRMLEYTGCDGVMIARGAVGNPMIFTQVREYVASGTYRNEYNPGEKLMCAVSHLKHLIAEKGEKQGCVEMRKHFHAYTKGLPDSASLRKLIVYAETEKQYLDSIYQYIEEKKLAISPPII